MKVGSHSGGQGTVTGCRVESPLLPGTWKGSSGVVLDLRFVRVARRSSWGRTSLRLHMNMFGESLFAKILTTSGLEDGGGGS